MEKIKKKKWVGCWVLDSVFVVKIMDCVYWKELRELIKCIKV